MTVKEAYERAYKKGYARGKLDGFGLSEYLYEQKDEDYRRAVSETINEVNNMMNTIIGLNGCVNKEIDKDLQEIFLEQSPHKPIAANYCAGGNIKTNYHCPRCLRCLDLKGEYRYCPRCGQAIDWSDVK